VVCAGQEPKRDLFESLKADTSHRAKLFMIGGAHEAGELDAKRAIDQGTRYASHRSMNSAIAHAGNACF